MAVSHVATAFFEEGIAGVKFLRYKLCTEQEYRSDSRNMIWGCCI